MNIQDYIREVVSQIAKGVNDVIREQEQYNVIINPKMTIGDSVDIRFIPKNIDSYIVLARFRYRKGTLRRTFLIP